MKITKPAAYLILTVSIILEITGDTALEACHGYSRILLSLAALTLIGVSFYLFSKVLHIIDLPVAYSSWTALGASACAILGVILFKQDLSPAGWLSLAGIITGTVVMNIWGTAEAPAEPDESEG